MALSLLHRATAFALKAHEGFDREGDSPLPYFTHPIEVLANLRFVGRVTDPDMLCAAILHDTVEGGTVSLADIQKEFGPRVAGLVKELTRCEPTSDQTSGMDKSEVWEFRSSMLLAEISGMSADAQTIKLADRLANLNEAKRMKKGKKLERYLDQTKRILKIIPEAVNPSLWWAIREEL